MRCFGILQLHTMLLHEPDHHSLLQTTPFGPYDSPFGGNFALCMTPAFVMRTHFNVERYDHVPSHLSKNMQLFASVKSGRSTAVSSRTIAKDPLHVQKPFSYSFSSVAIFIRRRSSLVLAGLPGLRSFFNCASSSSC